MLVPSLIKLLRRLVERDSSLRHRLVFLSVCVSVCVSVCLCVCLSVCLSVCLCVSICLSVCLSVCLAVSSDARAFIDKVATEAGGER